MLPPSYKDATEGARPGDVSVRVVDEPMDAKGFKKSYELGKQLGVGNFAVVVVGTHLATREEYAVKCIVKQPENHHQEADLIQEITILQRLKNHPNITGIHQFFLHEKKFYYVVVEYMKGGELFDRIVAKAGYNEKEARELCRILLDTVNYMHENHIVHRDLKPENLLLTSHSDDASVKIADFGLARSVADGSVNDACGTPAFVAPEILRHDPYRTEPDMWSVGVIIYTLLSGTYPFQDYDQRRLYRKIRAGVFNFHERYWSGVSDEAKNLIKKLLTVNQAERYTAAQALTHPWMLKRDVDLLARNLDDNLHVFKVTNAKRKLLAAVHSVRLAQRFADVGGLDEW